MNDDANLQVIKLLGWKVYRAPVDEQGKKASYGTGHPEYTEAVARSNVYGVTSPDIYPYEKLSSGYCDKWFNSEEAAYKWIMERVYFSSDLDQAMSLFDGTGVTVCLSKPPANDEHYSAYLTDHPIKFTSNLYSVSTSWAESVCMCWIKYKVETES